MKFITRFVCDINYLSFTLVDFFREIYRVRRKGVELAPHMKPVPPDFNLEPAVHSVRKHLEFHAPSSPFSTARIQRILYTSRKYS